MNGHESATGQKLRVASELTGQTPITHSISREWFERDLKARTCWAAAIAAPRLRGRRLKATVETMTADGGRAEGWKVTLSSHDDVLFARLWPLSVLQPTAAIVGEPCRDQVTDGSVPCGVGREEDGQDARESAEPDGGIEFGSNQSDNELTVPSVAEAPELAAARVVVRPTGRPHEATLVLHERAFEALMAGISDSRCATTELAWAGHAMVGYAAGERMLTWEVATLARLDAPLATATRCPVGAESLVDVLGPGVPVLFAHSHVVPSHWESAPDDRHLRCSADDLRSYRQLPMGSLGIIVGSRLPLRMRAYGWRPDTWELAELHAAMAVRERTPE